MTQPNAAMTPQAIAFALDHNLLARCPIHHDVLVALADVEDSSPRPDDPQLAATVEAVVEVTPHFCPLCVNDDPE